MLSQMEVSAEQAAPLREAGLSAEEKIRVGRIIGRLRRRKKLSQHALAQRMGVSRSQLCNVEAGRNRASAVQLVAIAEILGTSVSAILDGHHQIAAAKLKNNGHKAAATAAPCPYGYSLEDRLILGMYRALSEHQREQVAEEIVRLIQTAQTER